MKILVTCIKEIIILTMLNCLSGSQMVETSLVSFQLRSDVRTAGYVLAEITNPIGGSTPKDISTGYTAAESP